MAKTPTLKQRSLPQHGVISGGLLDGWRYGLDEVRIEKNAVVLHVQATQPNWPFPKLVRLTGRDFKTLRNPGAIAKEHDTQTLIDAAIERAGTGK